MTFDFSEQDRQVLSHSVSGWRSANAEIDTAMIAVALVLIGIEDGQEARIHIGDFGLEAPAAIGRSICGCSCPWLDAASTSKFKSPPSWNWVGT